MDGQDERELLDRVDDERRASRGIARRRTQSALAWLVLAAAVGLGVAACVRGVPRAETTTALLVTSVIAYSGLCAGLGLSVLSSCDALAARRTVVEGAVRAHRDATLEGWEPDRRAALRAENRALDDLDDARRARREAVRRPVVAGSLLVVAVALLVAGLVTSGQPAAWSTGQRFGLTAVSGVAVAAAAALLPLLGARQLRPTRRNLLRARRRHREAALYDDDPDGLPDAELVEVPPVRWTGRTVVALMVVSPIAAALLVPAPPGGDLASVAAGQTGAQAPPPPTVLAAREVPVSTNYPGGIAVSADGRRAWLANTGAPDRPDDLVSVIDLTTDSVLTGITVAPGPRRLALSPDGAHLYVASIRSPTFPRGALSLVDTASSTVTWTVPLPEEPADVGVAPDGRTAWATVADRDGRGGLAALDAGTGRLEGVVDTGSGPYRLAVAPDGARVYVTDYEGGDLAVVDTGSRRVTGRVQTGPGPSDVLLDAVRGTVWVAHVDERDPRRGLTVVDVRTLAPTPVDLGPIPPGTTGPVALALTPDGRRLLVARYSLNSDPHPLVVLDPTSRTTVGTVAVPAWPFQIAATPDGHHAYATSGSLWSIDVP